VPRKVGETKTNCTEKDRPSPGPSEDAMTPWPHFQPMWGLDQWLIVIGAALGLLFILVFVLRDDSTPEADESTEINFWGSGRHDPR
jgi:hypothetical protein